MKIYVAFYAQIAKLLQRRKMLLLKKKPIKDRPQTLYSKHTMFEEPTKAKLNVYNYFQEIFAKLMFLSHFDHNRKLYADVDLSKKNKIGAIIFYVKDDLTSSNIFARKNIKPIIFFSKYFTPAKLKY